VATLARAFGMKVMFAVIAWTSTEAQQTLADQRIDNLESFARGTPTNVVLGAF
jgi:glycerate dehydrogenase